MSIAAVSECKGSEYVVGAGAPETATDLAVLVDKVSDSVRKGEVEEFFGHVGKTVVGDRIFYVIHKDRQNDVDWDALTPMVLADMGLSEGTKRIQVVGDSACYGEGGTYHNRRVLEANIPRDSLILWGFTGRLREGGRRADVNGLVNELIDSNPGHWSGRCLANVVSWHTKAALGMPGERGWGCDGSHCAKHFWLVYGEDDPARPETQARFGDDTISSDTMSQSVISLEGGIQSLKQAFFCLEKGQELIVTSNTRQPDSDDLWVHTREGVPLYREETIYEQILGVPERVYTIYSVQKDPEEDAFSGTITYTGSGSQMRVEDIRPYITQEKKYFGNFFSLGGISEFFQMHFNISKSAGKTLEDITPDVLRDWWDKYSRDHLVANPKARDFDTKQKLFEDAKERFIHIGHKILTNVRVVKR